MKHFLFLFLLSCLFVNAVGQSRFRQNMRKFKSAVGEWSVTTQVNSRDGSVTREEGTYRITYELDSFYIRVSADMRNVANQRRRLFEQNITYNPDSAKFEVLYLYSGTPLRVYETGVFDASGKIFSTIVKAQPATGMEFLRSELDLRKDGEMVHRLWARKKKDGPEFFEFIATMKRKT